MKRIALVFLTLVCSTTPLYGAGFAHSDNFLVFTPADPADREATRAYAEHVLECAERYRKEIALEWLGEELPPSVGKAIINVRFSESRDTGFTWAKDHPSRRCHNIYLTASPDGALGPLLAHEVGHVVVATRFPHPNRLANWVEEGIASRYDDADRVATRERTLHWFTKTGNWPNVHDVILADTIPSDDKAAYSVAASLTELLLQHGDKRKLLQFADAARRDGWDRSLFTHYGIRDLGELQRRWQEWLASRTDTGDDLAGSVIPAGGLSVRETHGRSPDTRSAPTLSSSQRPFAR